MTFLMPYPAARVSRSAITPTGGALPPPSGVVFICPDWFPKGARGVWAIMTSAVKSRRANVERNFEYLVMLPGIRRLVFLFDEYFPAEDGNVRGNYNQIGARYYIQRDTDLFISIQIDLM